MGNILILDDASRILVTRHLKHGSTDALDRPPLVTVSCFSDTRWDEQQPAPLGTYPVRTMRLPEDVNDIDRYSDFVATQVADLSDFVLVGDSFGAVISLSVALRQPAGLRGLVLWGGFAGNPLPRWKAIAVRGSRFAGGPPYRHGTCAFTPTSSRPRFDRTAEVPLRQDDSRRLFVENTPPSLLYR